MNKNMSWDELFMNMTYLVSMKSKDTKTHFGAVIVSPNNEIRSFGYNGIPRKVNDDIQPRYNRPEKYYWFEHAERNAIYNAGRMGVPILNCKMYTNGIPCMDCARGIVQSGIKEVIVDKSWESKNKGKWLEHAKRTKEMFSEAGVKLRQVDFNLRKIEKYKEGL